MGLCVQSQLFEGCSLTTKLLSWRNPLASGFFPGVGVLFHRKVARVTKRLGAEGPPGRDGPGLAASCLRGLTWLARAAILADVVFCGNWWHFYNSVQSDPSAWVLYSVAINLGSSPGLWAAIAASYCPSRPRELPKLTATEYRIQADGSPWNAILHRTCHTFTVMSD